MLIEYTAPEKVNPLLADAQALLDAHNGGNDKAADQLIVKDADAGKTVFNYQQAAIALGYTARIMSQEPETDKKGEPTGNTVLIFRYSDKRKSGPRKPYTRKGGTVDTGADVPETSGE